MSLKDHGPSVVPAELKGFLGGIWGGIQGYRRSEYKILEIGSRLWELFPSPWCPATQNCFSLPRGACHLSPLMHAFLSLQPGFHTAGLAVEFLLIFMPSSSLSSPLRMATRSVLLNMTECMSHTGHWRLHESATACFAGSSALTSSLSQHGHWSLLFHEQTFSGLLFLQIDRKQSLYLSKHDLSSVMPSWVWVYHVVFWWLAHTALFYCR